MMPGKKTGRPKDMGKRAAIIRAARELFFAQGVAAVGMERIATAAAVSKVTVYGHFGDKNAIFEAIVQDMTGRFQEGIDALELSDMPLVEALRAFGEQFLTQLFHPELLGFDDILAVEAHRHPDLARLFFRLGPGQIRDDLARALKSRAARGELAIKDATQAAEHLVGLCGGMLAMEVRLHQRRPPSRSEMRERVAAGVDVFLRSYRA